MTVIRYRVCGEREREGREDDRSINAVEEEEKEKERERNLRRRGLQGMGFAISRNSNTEGTHVFLGNSVIFARFRVIFGESRTSRDASGNLGVILSSRGGRGNEACRGGGGGVLLTTYRYMLCFFFQAPLHMVHT